MFRCGRRSAVPARLTAAAAAADADELTPVLERVKFDVAFMHRIVSYRIVSRYFV